MRTPCQSSSLPEVPSKGHDGPPGSNKEEGFLIYNSQKMAGQEAEEEAESGKSAHGAAGRHGRGGQNLRAIHPGTNCWTKGLHTLAIVYKHECAGLECSADRAMLELQFTSSLVILRLLISKQGVVFTPLALNSRSMLSKPFSSMLRLA